jgi:hypothetical protein
VGRLGLVHQSRHGGEPVRRERRVAVDDKRRRRWVRLAIRIERPPDAAGVLHAQRHTREGELERKLDARARAAQTHELRRALEDAAAILAGAQLVALECEPVTEQLEHVARRVRGVEMLGQVVERRDQRIEHGFEGGHEPHREVVLGVHRRQVVAQIATGRRRLGGGIAADRALDLHRAKSAPGEGDELSCAGAHAATTRTKWRPEAISSSVSIVR